jgi:hypothetical protein
MRQERDTPRFQQQLHHIKVPRKRGVHQWRKEGVVLGVGICRARKQLLLAAKQSAVLQSGLPRGH